jgi:hypothetical protein
MPASEEPRPPQTALQRVHGVRERAISVLSDAFAQDALDVDEFERRVTRAHTSESPEEIEALLADLPNAAVAATAPAAGPVALVPAVQEAPAETVYAILGGVDRRGSWTVPRRFRVVAMMGGAMIDLREARFPRGVIELEVKAFWGGVQILVPPGLAVEVHGTAIMGGFQNVNRAPPTPDPEAPLLRVRGIAVMGGVDISMQLPGESARQAHRRRRLEARRNRRALPDRA